STGIGAPPEVQTFIESLIWLMSKPVSSTNFRSAQYIVGTPTQKFTRSLTIVSSVALGSNRGSSTQVFPAYKFEFICTVCPVVWNSGSVIRHVLGSPSVISSIGR